AHPRRPAEPVADPERRVARAAERRALELVGAQRAAARLAVEARPQRPASVAALQDDPAGVGAPLAERYLVAHEVDAVGDGAPAPVRPPVPREAVLAPGEARDEPLAHDAASARGLEDVDVGLVFEPAAEAEAHARAARPRAHVSEAGGGGARGR